jgi:hypothetical protein
MALPPSGLVWQQSPSLLHAVPFFCVHRGGYPSLQHSSPAQQKTPPQAVGAPPASGTVVILPVELKPPLQHAALSQWPEQHWLSLAHDALGPSGRHVWQAPFGLQKSVPQHPCCASQLHPVCAQQVWWSLAHMPLQQLGHDPCCGRRNPVSKHASAPQCPSWQARPSQQSSSELQGAAISRHEQLPPTQRRRAQQSASLVQVPLLA